LLFKLDVSHIMTSIDTTIDIDAPPEALWEVLTELATYPEWNPHITSAEGQLTEDERLAIVVDREGDHQRNLKVIVTAVKPEEQLEWVGTVGHRYLFQGHHSFKLEPLDDNRTRFHNRERISGLLASLFTTAEPERDYRAMNEALRLRAERHHKEGFSA
jgi:hypothetical protein